MHGLVAVVATVLCGLPCDDVVFSSRANDIYRGYRLGDVLSGYVAPGTSWENETKTWYLCDKWPVSLACRYRKSTRHSRNVAVLSSLLPATKPRNTTVLHVRLGDGVGGPECWEMPCYGQHGRERAGIAYSFSRRHYAQVVQRLPRQPITVVGNPYHTMDARAVHRSLVYLKLLVCFLRANNFEVAYHGDAHSPDDDFTTMATANVFVRGGGGYSTFAASVVRYRGYTVVH